IGDSTDIVKKETFDFADRGSRMITLRPEGTASIVRAVIENKLYATMPQPLKLFYYGPMFRYERPQKGRQRQFHQFGAEAIGSESPYVDSEIIAYSVTFLKALQIPGIVVRINTLGDASSKENYKQVLKEYLTPQIGGLCEDCQRRYLENPLRVLDCKVDSDSTILKNAPKPKDSLSEKAEAHFKQVLANLDRMGIDYVVDPSLVRGLDYYTHTVFEIDSNLETLGSQKTLCGGGRYDKLSESLDGPSLPSVGFAFGLERLLLALDALEEQEIPDSIHAFMVSLGEEAREKSLPIIEMLRHGGLVVEHDYDGKTLKAQFKQAEKFNPMFYLFYGSDEDKKGVVNVKNAKTGVQEEIPFNKLYAELVTLIRKEHESCSGNCASCGGNC
ncbi:MAG TPA: histidine--tRNA ligase, partial [Bacillota bacterium]|nr:histidine--tRNA ligase [Bacillota bacterium]